MLSMSLGVIKLNLKKFESMGISNDLRGFKVIKIPPRYMADDASEDEKKTLEIFKEILRSIHNGEQSGVLLPQQWDENGKPLFEFDVKKYYGASLHMILMESSHGIRKRLYLVF